MGTNPKSLLSPRHIVQKCYDEADDRIRVDAQLTTNLAGDLEIAVDSTEDSVAIGDTAGNKATTTVVGGNTGLDVYLVGSDVATATEATLSGFRTENDANLDIVNSSLASIDTKVATSDKQDIGNTSLAAINTKVSTAVKQDTGNTSLASIDTKVATSSKQDTGNTSLDAINTKVSTAAKQDTGNTSLGSIDTKLSTTNTTLSSIDAGIPASLGQATSANSLPVTIASDQSPIATICSYKTRTDTFITTGNGTTIDSSSAPLKSYSIMVKGTGTPTSWDVRLEGSLDNVNFTQILQHTNTLGDGAIIFSGASCAPVFYFRSRCAALTLGPATNIAVIILGVT